MKCSVIYYSKTHNTETMANCIVEGMNRIEGIEARAFPIENVDAGFAKESQGVVFGSPVYCGSAAAAFLSWFEENSKGLELAGKLGGAFATEQYIHGGATDTIVDILRRLLVCGMMVYSSGYSCGTPVIHFGPVEVSPNTDDFKDLFRTYGERFATQVKRVACADGNPAAV